MGCACPCATVSVPASALLVLARKVKAPSPLAADPVDAQPPCDNYEHKPPCTAGSSSSHRRHIRQVGAPQLARSGRYGIHAAHTRPCQNCSWCAQSNIRCQCAVIPFGEVVQAERSSDLWRGRQSFGEQQRASMPPQVRRTEVVINTNDVQRDRVSL